MENWLLNLIWVYLLAVNTLAFSLMGIDKRRAKRGAWRIAERTLFLPVVLFGSLGGTLGMFCFHHKTKHWYFAMASRSCWWCSCCCWERERICC